MVDTRNWTYWQHRAEVAEKKVEALFDVCTKKSDEIQRGSRLREVAEKVAIAWLEDEGSLNLDGLIAEMADLVHLTPVSDRQNRPARPDGDANEPERDARSQRYPAADTQTEIQPRPTCCEYHKDGGDTCAECWNYE